MSTYESDGTFPESGAQPAKPSFLQEYKLRYTARQAAGRMWPQIAQEQRRHARFQALRVAMYGGLLAVAQAQGLYGPDESPDDAEIMAVGRDWQSPMAVVAYRPTADSSVSDSDRLVLSKMTGPLAKRVAYDFGFVPKSLASQQLVLRMPGFLAEQASEPHDLEIGGRLIPAPGMEDVIRATEEFPADCTAVARLLVRHDVFRVQ
jgi:hypothetical protein